MQFRLNAKMQGCRGAKRGRASAAVAVIVAVVFATVPVKSGFGQPATNSPIQTLSLAQAREIAFEKNWDLLAAKTGIESATAQLIVAKEFPNPTASLSLANFATHNIATIEGNGVWQRSYDTIAAVSQLIEIGGKRHDRQAAARSGTRGARARFYDAKRTLDQGVTKAYVASLLAVYNQQVLHESVRYMKHEANIAQSRFSAGDLSDSDLKQIQISAEQFELQETAANAAAVQARIQVEILMGAREPKGDWAPADSLEQMDAVVPPPLESAAGAARPDVLAAEADLIGGKYNLKLQQATRIPDPSVSIQYEHNPVPPGPPPDDTFGIGVSFPLPLWNLNGGNIKAAQAAIDQFELALGKVKAQNASDVATAQVEYREAHDRLQRYQTLIVPQSARSRAAVSFAFEKGSATLVDLLEAERTDNTVRMSMAQAQADTASAVADVIAAQNVVSQRELEARK